jgi:hypothetical protein
MPYSGTGRYYYRIPSARRFDYRRDFGSDTAWNTILSTAAPIPFRQAGIMPPFPARSLLDSIAARTPAVSSANGVVALSYDHEGKRATFRIDRARWLIVARTHCTPNGDSCLPDIFAGLYYAYKTVSGIPVVSSITAYPPDSADAEALHAARGGYVFTDIHVNESLPDSLFSHAVFARNTLRQHGGGQRRGATPFVAIRGRGVRDLLGRRLRAPGLIRRPGAGVYILAPEAHGAALVVQTRGYAGRSAHRN